MADEYTYKPPSGSVVAIMEPRSGAAWVEWYGTMIEMNAQNEVVTWRAAIPAGYNRYRFVAWYGYSITGISLRHFSGKWKDGDTLAFNVRDSDDLMYPFSSDAKIGRYADGWESLDGSAYNVGGYISLNNVGVWVRMMVTVEFDTESV